MRLKNKVAVITGAASGIGKEIALTFAREGASVVVADLNGEAANAVANELSEMGAISGDSTALAVAMNVSDEEQVEAGIEKVITFDMGGTSTDVALLSGELRTTSETVYPEGLLDLLPAPPG